MSDETPPVETPPAEPPVTPPAEPPANYFEALPDTWRGDMLSFAGYEGDELESRSGQLERVLDMPTLVKNYFNAQDKIRAGELSNGLPADPTDEQLAEWREANGVPATHEDYDIQLAEGLVLGEDDERILGSVREAFHTHNVSNAAATAAVNAMLAGREAEIELLEQNDGIQAQQAQQALKDTWRGDYTVNHQMIKNYLSIMPQAIQDGVMNARMPDGRALMNSPEFLVFLADTARKLNPGGAVVPNSENQMQSINQEIAELEKRMGEDNTWFSDKEAQQRYQDLVTARDQMNQKGAAA